MGIEGLEYILSKQEIVPTVSASDLIHRPGEVEMDYHRHVRTYVPINRAASGDAETLSVTGFEEKVIKGIKAAKSVRGYLTAEYGYGKTSTALYLWNRAEENRLIVVPPFQMLHLPDLVDAIYGWVSYRFSVNAPQFIPSLDDLYNNLRNRSLEKEAQDMGVSVKVLQQRVDAGRFTLELQTNEYITFFEQATDLVRQAGYEGLLVLADEVQQYIEPEIASASDPIAPFFNLVQAMLTREGRLHMGILFIIGLKEVGVLRDRRNDLLHRLREYSLDLTNVYDYDFATNLWKQLARAFDFRDIQEDIVSGEALQALGQITSRTDLSDGPRTVINTFRRMVQRYKLGGINIPKYNPIDLIEDLIGGEIQFSGNDAIQRVAQQMLRTTIIKEGGYDYEQAIKLAAAFPAEGVPNKIQRAFGLEQTFQDLARIAIGEIIVSVGPPEQQGFTLYGLEPVKQSSDWLSQTIRDFRRGYGERQKATQDRAVRAFAHIVKNSLFKDWKILSERESSFTSNHSIILEGTFQTIATRYPKRRVHVRIFWEDEPLKDATTEGDIAIHYFLSTHEDLAENPDERRGHTESAQLYPDDHLAVIPINLMYIREGGAPPEIQQTLGGVWSPYDLSPLVLMNIHQMLDEKKRDNQMPKTDEQRISSGFQPALIFSLIRDLFNAGVGEGLGGVQERRITEVAVEQVLDHRYRETYFTLMVNKTWRNTMQKYRNALGLLENTHQRRGEIEYEDDKTGIAKLFSIANASYDSLVSQLGQFIEQRVQFSNKQATGSIAFTLHDLEKQIMAWLNKSTRVEHVEGGTVRVLELSKVYSWSRDRGYLDEEIEELIQVLIERELIDTAHDIIREVPSRTVDLDTFAIKLQAFSDDLDALRQGFPDNDQLISLRDHADKWLEFLSEQRRSGTPEPQRVYRMQKNVAVRHNELTKIAKEKQREMRQHVGQLRKRLRVPRKAETARLDEDINASVQYVQHVNSLRIQLGKTTHKVRSDVQKAEQLLTQLEQTIMRDDLPHSTLSESVDVVEQLDTEITQVNDSVQHLEQRLTDLDGWRRLVDAGSNLWNQLERMGNIAQEFRDDFETISDSIREHITSAANRLDVLPDHHLFQPQVESLRQKTERLNNEQSNAFTQLQKRYELLLTQSGLYRRDQLGRPIVFNIAEPKDCYDRLYIQTQEKVAAAVTQLKNLIREHRQDAQSTINSPYMSDLELRVQESCMARGEQIVATSDEYLSQLDIIESQVKDMAVLRDLNAEGSGQFADIVNHLASIVKDRAQLKDGVDDVRQQLNAIRLSDDEEIALAALPDGVSEHGTVDIIDWLNRTNGHSPDAMWSAIRSLYEKQRIRITVSKVRR